MMTLKGGNLVTNNWGSPTAIVVHRPMIDTSSKVCTHQKIVTFQKPLHLVAVVLAVAATSVTSSSTKELQH